MSIAPLSPDPGPLRPSWPPRQSQTVAPDLPVVVRGRDTELRHAAEEAARVAAELLALHREISTGLLEDREVRAAWYRLDDAARTCRRASEEFRAAIKGH